MKSIENLFKWFPEVKNNDELWNKDDIIIHEKYGMGCILGEDDPCAGWVNIEWDYSRFPMIAKRCEKLKNIGKKVIMPDH